MRIEHTCVNVRKKNASLENSLYTARASAEQRARHCVEPGRAVERQHFRAPYIFARSCAIFCV